MPDIFVGGVGGLMAANNCFVEPEAGKILSNFKFCQNWNFEIFTFNFFDKKGIFSQILSNLKFNFPGWVEEELAQPIHTGPPPSIMHRERFQNFDLRSHFDKIQSLKILDFRVKDFKIILNFRQFRSNFLQIHQKFKIQNLRWEEWDAGRARQSAASCGDHQKFVLGRHEPNRLHDQRRQSVLRIFLTKFWWLEPILSEILNNFIKYLFQNYNSSGEATWRWLRPMNCNFDKITLPRRSNVTFLRHEGVISPNFTKITKLYPKTILFIAQITLLFAGKTLDRMIRDFGFHN